MDEIKLKYSEEFIRKAIRTYWFKLIGPVFPLVLVLLLAYLIYLLVNDDRSWLIGVMVSVIFLSFAIMAGTYFLTLSKSLKRFRRMNLPEAILALGEKRFRVSSDIGSSEIEWSQIEKAWCFEKFWILFFSASDIMTLPVTDIPSESKLYILEKLKSSGAKIEK